MNSKVSDKKLFRWLPDYSVGVPEIDHEHHGLFALAEKLHQAMRAGKGQEVLEDHIDDLLEYTSRHFTHEEELMEQIGYPHFQDHCREHEELRTRAAVMKQRVASGEISITVELMQFLMEWLKIHSTTSDRRIGTYMRKRGLVS
jgi:hemerythrin